LARRARANCPPATPASVLAWRARRQSPIGLILPQN
jgi:hypothetical protein